MTGQKLLETFAWEKSCREAGLRASGPALGNLGVLFRRVALATED
ncbi:MAG: hypothetical protein WB930_18890 [Syntrophobacteraceae bacterium]